MAEEPPIDAPASKKARTIKSQPHDLKSALFPNGVTKKLKAETTTSMHATKIQHRVDDSKAVISKPLGHGNIQTPHISTKQLEVIEISSESSSSEDEDDEKEELDEETKTNGVTQNGLAESDGERAIMGEENEEEEITFGDLIAPTDSTTMVDVESILRTETDIARPSQSTIVPPSTTTLSTVLSQALRTNDTQLLESCLLVNDLSAVRGTISRLPSPLAESLLSALAARLHARPGRANNLMVWLQWTLVAHGGYLAGRQGLVARLGALQRAVRERANGLRPLLELKGRLDMLSAQMELRRGAVVEGESEDEGVVVYVESDSEDEDEKAVVEEEDDDDEAATNGVIDANDDDDSDEDSSDESDDSESIASSTGFSDQGVEEQDDSESEDDDDQAHVKPEIRKGR